MSTCASTQTPNHFAPRMGLGCMAAKRYMTGARANAAFAQHAPQFEPTKLAPIRVNQGLIGTLFLCTGCSISVNILVPIHVLLSVLVITVLGVLVILGSWGVAF